MLKTDTLDKIRVQHLLERIFRGSRVVYRHLLENLHLQETIGPLNINKELALSHVVVVVHSVPWRDLHIHETFICRAVRFARQLRRPGTRQRTVKTFPSLLSEKGVSAA